MSTSLLIRIVVSTSLLHQPLLPSHVNKKITAISSSLALSFFLFIDSRSLEHFSQFFVDKIERQNKRIYTTIKHKCYVTMPPPPHQLAPPPHIQSSVQNNLEINSAVRLRYIKRCSVRSSWAGRYTPPISPLLLCTLWFTQSTTENIWNCKRGPRSSPLLLVPSTQKEKFPI